LHNLRRRVVHIVVGLIILVPFKPSVYPTIYVQLASILWQAHGLLQVELLCDIWGFQAVSKMLTLLFRGLALGTFVGWCHCLAKHTVSIFRAEDRDDNINMKGNYCSRHQHFATRQLNIC
jgi:hypothetical protein